MHPPLGANRSIWRQRYPVPRETGGAGNGRGAILRRHSTDEGGEPQGSGDGRPRGPLEGRAEQVDVWIGRHMTVLRYRQTMSTQLNRIAELARMPGSVRGVVLEEPVAGNLHGGTCEGGGPGRDLASLFGHEAGNGGYRQGAPTGSRRSSSTRIAPGQSLEGGDSDVSR